MVPTVTVQRLVDDVRLMSALKRSTYFSDADIASFLADAASELQDIFVSAFEHYFIRSFKFILAGGPTGYQVELPNDFVKANLLQQYPSGTQLFNSSTIGLSGKAYTIPMLSNFLDRNRPTNFFDNQASGKHYQIQDNLIEVLPNNFAAGAYELLYTYRWPELTLGDVVKVQSPTPDFTVRAATTEPINSTFVLNTPNSISITDGLPFIDGILPNIGDILLFQHGSFDAPSSPHIFGVWRYDSHGTNWEFVRVTGYEFGNTILAGHKIAVTDGTANAGTIRILGGLWDVDVDFSSFFSEAYITALSSLMVFQGASFNSTMVGSTISISGSAHNDGDWIITSVPGPFAVTVSDPGGLLINEDLRSTVSVVVVSPGQAVALPWALTQWALFLKVHASIAIRTARQQDTADLDRKLAQQRARATSAATNRTEDVTQAPMRVRRGWLNGIGSDGNGGNW
jgi:hypothetical protein